jgi:hypothetical protein
VTQRRQGGGTNIVDRHEGLAAVDRMNLSAGQRLRGSQAGVRT